MLLHHEQIIITVTSAGGIGATILFWITVAVIWVRCLWQRVKERFKGATRWTRTKTSASTASSPTS